jgi:hypothetical protein
MTERPDEVQEEPRLNEVLRELPLLDDLFLGMQAMNVELVDGYLEDLEAELLQEYMASDRPPLASMMFVSALSQMWIFAAYELLRTWRQRAREIVGWGKRLRDLAGEERDAAIAAKREEIDARAGEARDGDVRWHVFERAADPQFLEELQLAVNRTELTFRDLEALRMTLAKHEVPRQHGMYAAAPGYARLDMSNGSFYWQVELGVDEVTLLSRRGLADALRALARRNDRILPPAIQERLVGMERQSYGVNRIVVVPDDGTEVPGVHVLWATVVGRVEGRTDVPFDVARVVDVRRDLRPDPEADEDALF